MVKFSITLSIIALLCIESYTFAQDKYQAHVTQPDSMQTPSICMVLTDPASEKNMIIWEKQIDPYISQYQVWKKSSTAYTLVSEIMEADTSVVIDWNSKPGTKTDAYVLVSVDTCGNASMKSPWHKPFLLQSNIGLNNVVNLSWQPYLVDGQEYIFKTIVIYRGTDSTKLAPIDTIAAGIGSDTYTDENRPLNLNVYYRIGGEKDVACNPNNIPGKKSSSGPYVHSLSNLEDNRLQIIQNVSGFGTSSEISIYPNPLETETRLVWPNLEGSTYGLLIYNMNGMLVRKISGIKEPEYTLSRGNLESGCYIIELRGSKTFHGRLLVN
jgi:hypothetical protein